MGTLIGLNNSRIAYIIPGYVQDSFSTSPQMGSQSIVQNLDSSYLAAGLAGLICGDTSSAPEFESAPITLKTLGALNDISYPIQTGDLTELEKNQLAGYGAFIFDLRGATIPVVRHALTTSQAGDPIAQELKVTVIADVLAKQLRTMLDASFIGTRNQGAPTYANIKAAVTSQLNSKVASGIIVSFRNLIVQQDPIEPRQINVSFQIIPALDCDWILITMGVSAY